MSGLEQGPLAGYCVWLVEDVSSLRALVATRLRQAGADVVEAADGAEVRALLPTARRPDLVCLDLGLPDVDGLTLAESLGPQCCVAFTASDDEDTRVRCERAGLPGILDKGSAEDLVDRVAEFILERTQRMAPTPQPVRLEDDVTVLRWRYLQFLAEQRFALSEFFRSGGEPSDPARVRSILHRLCGTAVHFDLPEVGQIAKILSSALKGSDPQLTLAAWERLDDCLGRSVDELDIAEDRRARDNVLPGGNV